LILSFIAIILSIIESQVLLLLLALTLTVKGDYKTLKEFVLALGEYRQAKAGAESALAILDEALQFKLSITTTPSSLAETEGFGSNTKEKTAKTGTTDTEGEVTNERSKNGFNRKLERNGALLQ